MKRIGRLLLIVFAVFCTFNLSSCGKTKIDTPVNLSIDDENNLIWNEVLNAKTYNISLYNVDKNTTVNVSSRKASFSLSELEEGDYQITVQSIASSKEFADSDVSEIMYFHKYQETGCVYKLINNNTEYAIAKVGSASGTFVIEDYYRGKAVTEISDKAFKGSAKIVNVTLGENIITIGESAFWNCPKLERVYIPTSVISIGKSCFQSCRSLVDIKIPDSISVIPDYCFAYCRSLTEMELPEGIKSIGEAAFVDCSLITTINIPNTTKTVGPSAFFGCEKLSSVTIGSGVESIGESAFGNTRNLTSVTFNSNSNIKEVGDSAFRECASLPSITFPEGLKTIGEGCFYNAKVLNEVHIPGSVTKVGSNAFFGTKLYVDQIESGASFVYADNWLIFSPLSVKNDLEEINTDTLKSTTVGIADNVFEACPKLKIVILPQSFKYIGAYAFNGCHQLWKLNTYDESIKIIGDFAFCDCALTNVYLGYGLERIGHFAFYNNQQLDNNELTPYDWIPESVTSIGKGAFKNTMIYTKSSYGSGIAYAGNWAVGMSLPLTSIDLVFDEDHVAGVADYAFMYEGYPELASLFSIRSVSGLTNCKYIGAGAFYGNTELSSVSLNRNLTEVREATFYNTGLVKATLPRSLKSIGDYAFMGTQLSNVDLSSTNVQTIGKSAFANVGGMTELVLGDSLESIGDYAFFNCSSIKSITIPESVTRIGENAFCGCETASSLKMSINVEVIENATFAHCTNLKTVTNMTGVKTINSEAFYVCKSLESIETGSNLETIGDAAFFGNESLITINLYSKIKKIGVYAFEGCKSLESIVLPLSLRSVQQHAFYECDNLTIYTSMDSKPGDWHNRFNSSYRPIFWSTELDGDNTVLSITLSSNTIDFKNALNGIKAPICNSKQFLHWIDEESNTYNMSDILSITDDKKLMAVYENIGE